MAKQQRTSNQRRIGIRDRLGQLTYQAACRLFGEDARLACDSRVSTKSSFQKGSISAATPSA